MAAMSRSPSSSDRASDSGSSTASIEPGGCACISRPRSATTASASSRVKHAGEAGGDVLADAVADHRGRPDAPVDASSRASAYSTTNRAGCVTARLARAARRRSVPALAGTGASARSSPRCRLEDARRSRRRCRGSTGSLGRGRAPCAAYCAPWPGNMNDDRRRPCAATTPVTTLFASRIVERLTAVLRASRAHERPPVGEGAASDLQRVGDVGEVDLRVRPRRCVAPGAPSPFEGGRACAPRARAAAAGRARPRPPAAAPPPGRRARWCRRCRRS